MASKLMTPGVYIEEKNAFPSSAVAVETAVPAFIGYTEKAVRNGKSLLNQPTRITSFAEYVERFGGGFKAKFTVKDPEKDIKQDTFVLNGKEQIVVANKNNTAYLFNSIRLFYANGGGPCYIISVGNYGDSSDGFEIKAEDFLDKGKEPGPLKLLEKEHEPTLIVIPDAIHLGEACYSTIYTQVLDHCGRMQNRFAIFDLVKQAPSDLTDKIVETFRTDVGMNFLNYGAAYYPWLKSAVVQPSEVNFENLDNSIKLEDLLPEPAAKEAAKKFATLTPGSVTIRVVAKMIESNTKAIATYTNAKETEKDAEKKKAIDAKIGELNKANTALTTHMTALDGAEKKVADTKKANDEKKTDATLAAYLAAKDAWDAAVKDASAGAYPDKPGYLADMGKANYESEKTNFHQALKANSASYVNIIEEIRSKLNELPPSGAMAGLYTSVDNSRGVWKSPANISVNMVNAPSVNISNEGQEKLNVDILAGKSINVIRTFPGIGTLVWGGRTLDGNSQDWRYINVRRTLIMIEQSLKLAARAYVFEPNDANTWITVKSMISNFLTNLWKQGALAGAAPEQAFDVQIGLGATMTADDILDGKMLITVKVAIVRPAEFIVITFQQQMQQS